MSTDKPTIVIFCESMRLGDQPFNEEYYWFAYQDLLLALKERGMDVYFASGDDSYLGAGNFSVAYTVDHETSLRDVRTVHDVHADLVFDRGDFKGTDMPVLNHPSLLRIAENKVETYKRFGRFQPFSVICENRADVEAAFDKIQGDMIVVKGAVSFGGHDVFIGRKDEVLSQVPEVYPLLVQEFQDTSAGVPGGVSGVHDIRLSVCGGEIIGYYVRQAKAGSLLSNVSQGGRMVFYGVDKVPAKARAMAMQIDEEYKDHPRYYSSDFMYTPDGWKLVETNTYPALLPKTDGPEAVDTLNRLADYLVEVCRRGR